MSRSIFSYLWWFGGQRRGTTLQTNTVIWVLDICQNDSAAKNIKNTVFVLEHLLVEVIIYKF